ncbi:MAG: cobyric acid synthase [Burkholderiales bacterium]|nr:cobyric acid synthase [Burkholderiales bacterium]
MTPRRARAVMVCGTTSGAGKSLIATALCRWYARRGLQVAPFKSQNMSNNARVVAGGEIGSAQYFQALAARCVPEVRMNPVLLKPERDDQSQVILLGQRHDEFSRMDWRGRSERLWPAARQALHELMAENELVVIEGAGSPAEINLHASDIVNMRVACEAGAAVLLASDIDRGGSFAHLYGTHQLLPPEERALIRGFLLNKFRGDAGLLAPGPAMLQELTGVPTVGVLPMVRGHGLPEEDGVQGGSLEAAPRGAGAGPVLRIAVVAYPRISNLDEFQPLVGLPGVQLVWAREPGAADAADWLILPGSKHVAEDLRWLRQTGLDAAIGRHVRSAKPLLAICGGLQMLGRELQDPQGVEGSGKGLGLLALATRYDAAKIQRRARLQLRGASGCWAALDGLAFDAYEIRHGRSALLEAAAATPVLPDGAGWQQGSLLALYAHGLFEDSGVMRALFGAEVASLDSRFERLADLVEAHVDTGFLESLVA